MKEYSFNELVEIAKELGLERLDKKNVGIWAKENGFIKHNRLVAYYTKEE